MDNTTYTKEIRIVLGMADEAKRDRILMGLHELGFLLRERANKQLDLTYGAEQAESATAIFGLGALITGAIDRDQLKKAWIRSGERDAKAAKVTRGPQPDEDPLGEPADQRLTALNWPPLIVCDNRDGCIDVRTRDLRSLVVSFDAARLGESGATEAALLFAASPRLLEGCSRADAVMRADNLTPEHPVRKYVHEAMQDAMGRQPA